MARKKPAKKAPVAERPHMPGYGIDEKDREGLLPWAWAEKHLSKTQNYLVATVRPDGRPHLMPVWGIWMDDRFYFSTGRKSVKGRNLANNPNCIVFAGEADEALILEGRAAKARDKATLSKFASLYLKKYKFDPSTMNEPIFSVRPRVAFGQIEKTFVKTATRWTF